MIDAVDRLVEQWGALHQAYATAAHQAKLDTILEAQPSLTAAGLKLDLCVTEIADALRTRIHETENTRDVHAARLRTVKKSLGEARQAVEIARRMVAHTRDIREHGREIRADNADRWERILSRSDRKRQSGS